MTFFMKNDLADLSETCVESKRIYEGRIVNLRYDSVKLTDGRLVSREVVEHKPAVVILAENDSSEIAMVRQHRYAAGETMLELPAGIVEQGEDFKCAAIREMREETGWRPAKIEKISEFYTSPGFSNELIVMFYATGLTMDSLPMDEDEIISACFVSREEIENLLALGELRDCKTLLGLHWWFDRLNRRRA